jgi:adenylate kinase
MRKEQLGFNLVLLGQIASGKDTQAKLLQGKYNLIPVESGKYFRELSKANSKDGELLRKTVGVGKPAPVAIMKKFLIEELKKREVGKDLIFIGNPRLKPEAQLLKKLSTHYKENFFALYITLPDKEIYSRSSRGDRSDDDNKIKIKKRIKWHKDQVSKTVKYFESLKKLKKIKGNQSVEKVSQDIEKALEYFKKLNNN